MPAVCIRSIDTSRGKPLLTYPVYCGGFRAAADSLPRERDQHQEARSRDASRPICTPCNRPWREYLHGLDPRQAH